MKPLSIEKPLSDHRNNTDFVKVNIFKLLYLHLNKIYFLNRSGLTQELSETLIPLCPLRPLRFVLS